MECRGGGPGGRPGTAFGVGSFPIAERQAGRILSLPVYPELRTDQLAYTADLIRQFYS